MQLAHDAAEQGTFRDAHGFIAILKDGVELVRDESYQHNRGYHERDGKVPKLVAEVVKKHGEKKNKIVVDSGSVVGAPAAAAL